MKEEETKKEANTISENDLSSDNSKEELKAETPKEEQKLRSIGLVAEKQGMTRFYTEDGNSYAVTLISAEPNVITQIKTKDKEGYCSIQVTTGKKKDKHLNKAEKGHYKKASVKPGQGLWEFLVPEESIDGLKVGNDISMDQFQEGELVDISGTTKGKGFAGVVKRWNFKMQDATHGNSLSHRAPGSIGQCQTPGRVWKGKKMSGHLGNCTKTIQNLKIASLDKERNLLVIRGSIPGPNGATVILKPAVK